MPNYYKKTIKGLNLKTNPKAKDTLKPIKIIRLLVE